MKLDIYEKIKNEMNLNDSERLANYLQTKVSKMERNYLELLFQMIFNEISNKDEIVQLIAKNQIQQNISKKVYKTVIQPKYNIIPFNVKNIENILNRVHNIDSKSGRRKDKSMDACTQTGGGEGISKMTVAIHHNSSVDKINHRCKIVNLFI